MPTPDAGPDRPDPSTICARPPDPNPSSTPPLAPPIQLSSVYEFADLEQVDAVYEGRESGFIYARDGHPNASQLAAKVAAIEGGEAALVCGSGMAAESALMLGLPRPGRPRRALRRALRPDRRSSSARELARFGIGHDLFDAVPARDAPRGPDARGPGWPSSRRSRTRCCAWPTSRGWPRSPARPGVTLAVDHTFAPLLCRPLATGGRRGDPLGDEADRRPQRRDARAPGRRPRRLIDRASPIASTFGLTGQPVR